MTSKPEPPKPARYAGFPLSAWSYALRNWLAMVLALYVAFWLQLGSPATAATCVGILSLPTRGQMLQKAAFRILGTIIGVMASFAIAGLFNEVRDLLLAASGIWISLCVFAAGMLDGNRSYAAVLSGYTVAIVTVADIDSPQDVFTDGVNRGAAIIIGILSISVVSEIIRAPDMFPQLLDKIESAHGKVRKFAAATLRRGASDPGEIATLFGEITALRPDTTLMPFELVTGPHRSAGARAACSSMIHQVVAAHHVTASLVSIGSAGEEHRAALEAAIGEESGKDSARLRERIQSALATHGPTPQHLVAASAGLIFLERDRSASRALSNMRAGRAQKTAANLPIWRSRNNAARNALRNLAAFAVTTIFLVAFSNWPATSGALDGFAAVIGICATNASPATVAFSAMLVGPIAALAAGVTEFVFLDGADQFPLLALAIAPTIIIASLAGMSGKPLPASLGTLSLVLFPILLSPSNPQSYNAEQFLSSCMLVILALVLVFVCLSVILPTDDALRRRWIEHSSWEDFRRAMQGKLGRYTVQTAAWRDADRIAQLGGLKDKGEEAQGASVRRALRLFDLASCSRRIRELFTDRSTISPQEAARIHSALSTLDPAGLREAADEIRDRSEDASGGLPAGPRQAVAELVHAAALVERYDNDIRHPPPGLEGLPMAQDP